MSAKNFQPFRFMDLPKELRLMVFEALPRTIHYYDIPHGWRHLKCHTLVIRSVPISILATNRQVHNEAEPILNKTITKFILDSPPRIIEGFRSANYPGDLIGLTGLMIAGTGIESSNKVINIPSLMSKYLGVTPDPHVYAKLAIFGFQANKQLRHTTADITLNTPRRAIEIWRSSWPDVGGRHYCRPIDTLVYDCEAGPDTFVMRYVKAILQENEVGGEEDKATRVTKDPGDTRPDVKRLHYKFLCLCKLEE